MYIMLTNSTASVPSTVFCNLQYHNKKILSRGQNAVILFSSKCPSGLTGLSKFARMIDTSLLKGVMAVLFFCLVDFLLLIVGVVAAVVGLWSVAIVDALACFAVALGLRACRAEKRAVLTYGEIVARQEGLTTHDAPPETPVAVTPEETTVWTEQPRITEAELTGALAAA